MTTPQDVIDAVFNLIDEKCAPGEMSKEDYLEVLQGVRDDADMRAQTVEQEIDDENNDD